MMMVFYILGELILFLELCFGFVKLGKHKLEKISNNLLFSEKD